MKSPKIRSYLIHLAFLSFFLPPSVLSIELTFFHMTDLHGYLFPYRDKTSGKKIGSLASMVPLLKKARKEGRNPLFFDAGDLFQGTLEDEMTKGSLGARMVGRTELGLFGRVMGNHDFDYGWQRARENFSPLNCQHITTNLKSKDPQQLSYLIPHTLLDSNGVKIGIFGLLTSHTPAMSFPENIQGIEFQEEWPVIEKTVHHLRNSGAQLIILISHMGFFKYQSDHSSEPLLKHLREDLFSKIKLLNQNRPGEGINLIIDGHSHDEIFYHFQGDPTHPLDDLYLAQAGHYGRYLGELKVEWDPLSQSIQRVIPRLHDLDVQLNPPDTDYLKLFQKEFLALSRLTQKPILKVRPGFYIPHIDKAGFQPSPAAFVVANAFLHQAQQISPNGSGSVVNIHGVRGPLGSQAGTIHQGDLHTICPFKNKLVEVHLTPKDFKEILEEKGCFLGFGGFSFIKPKIGEGGGGFSCDDILDSRGNSLFKQEKVLLITSDYIAQSGEFSISKRKLFQKELGTNDQEALSNYLVHQGQLNEKENPTDRPFRLSEKDLLKGFPNFR